MVGFGKRPSRAAESADGPVEAMAEAVAAASAVLVTAPPEPGGCPGAKALIPALTASGAWPDRASTRPGTVLLWPTTRTVLPAGIARRSLARSSA